jgi:hypothetical protein
MLGKHLREWLVFDYPRWQKCARLTLTKPKSEQLINKSFCLFFQKEVLSFANAGRSVKSPTNVS